MTGSVPASCRADGLLIRQTCGWGQLRFEGVRLLAQLRRHGLFLALGHG